MNILKCRLYPSSSSSSLLSSIFLHPPDPWPSITFNLKKPSSSSIFYSFTASSSSFSSYSSSSLLSPSCSCAISESIPKSVIKSRQLLSSHQPILIRDSLSFCSSSYGPEQRGSDSDDDEPLDFSADVPDGPDYPNFAAQYRVKAEQLKKDLSRVTRLNRLFEIVYENIDYVGRINAGVFISRLSHLTDPREKTHRKMSSDHINFLTKLVLININVLPDANLLSLVAIILSQRLPDDDNLTITTLQEIRRRLKDLGIGHLVWLWKQSGFKVRSSERSREWSKLREEIINVVERRVNDFSYDFQNVTEISQLARILLSKPSSIPYLHRLIKNITIFTESIDYGLAWALLVQFTPSTRQFERIDSSDLTAIYSKCYQVIQQKLYENNFQADKYVKDYLFNRIIESPEGFKLIYDPIFYKTLVKLIKNNQKHLGPKGLLKCLYFFGCNQYYPTDLIAIICNWIKDHPNDYISDPDFRPNKFLKIVSESRYFECKQSLWEQLSQILLDPVKISCLDQEEKFRLLSYLLIIGDYTHLNKFCPEFDEICERTKLSRHFWRAFHHIYAALSLPIEPIGIEGQLIKQSLEKYVKRARKAYHFIDKSVPETDLDEILLSTLGDRSLFTKKLWTKINVTLNYVIAWDKKGKPFRFDSRGRNNVSLIDDQIKDLDNYHVIVLFPIDESHYCYDPLVMRGQFVFKLSMIKRLGFTPIIIDRRNWKDLTNNQKVSLIKREIDNIKTIHFGPSSTIKSSNN